MKCTCPANNLNSPGSQHADNCEIFACGACGAKTLIGQQHRIDCADRCPHCQSEGPDNDHVTGCPTIGTCAQCCPSIPREQGWHYDPPPGVDWGEWFDHHMATVHPNIERWLYVG